MQKTEPLITLTVYAQTYLERLVKEQCAIGVEISLEKAGCAGYMYRILPVSAQVKAAHQQVVSKNLMIFVPYSSVVRLQGSQLDYQQKQFETKAVFDNPNVRLACGCGESVEILERSVEPARG